MKARLIKINNQECDLYLDNGYMYKADNHILTILLRQFQNLDKLLSSEDSYSNWSNAYSDISVIPGETAAYVNDSNELVIKSYQPFDVLWNDIKIDFSDILVCEEYARAVGKSPEQIKQFLRQNRIPGARKIGRDWVIPKSSIDKYPMDNRVTAGGKFSKYKNTK